MALYFYITDFSAMGGEHRHQILIEKGFAATSGELRFGETLARLKPGDVLLMYENGIGIVAVGTVLEPWDQKSHKPPRYYVPTVSGFDHEFRIKVDWSTDLR